ncbi:sedoheptulose 7-phosphate cyclase [Nocardia sp. NPDC052278]|uniref:sedoheptulose 7-phosphate cyclase n=1 Tax=unclassified Nocardia TaxID=2637762 RepID=UPI0036A73186
MQAHQDVSYPIVLTNNLFHLDNPALIEASGGDRSRRLFVIDAEVNRIYGNSLIEYLDHYGVDHEILAVPVSESTKNLETAQQLARELGAYGLPRRSVCTTIGGGVLLDVAGVALSLLRRGTPYIRVGTTLLALVDAAFGVKVGVNDDGHKNRLGAYYPPQAALLDRSFLATLPSRQLANGVGEIVKLALMMDSRLFELLEQHGKRAIDEAFQPGTDDGPVAEILRAAVQHMRDELADNLWEHELSRLADFGHAVSPVLEMRALPELLHGEAVAIDMALFTVVAQSRGLGRGETDRILQLMRDLGLPTYHRLLSRSTLHAALVATVEHRDGRQRLPLPIGIGQATFVDDITIDELADAADYLAHNCDMTNGGAFMTSQCSDQAGLPR